MCIYISQQCREETYLCYINKHINMNKDWHMLWLWFCPIWPRAPKSQNHRKVWVKKEPSISSNFNFQWGREQHLLHQVAQSPIQLGIELNCPEKGPCCPCWLRSQDRKTGGAGLKPLFPQGFVSTWMQNFPKPALEGTDRTPGLTWSSRCHLEHCSRVWVLQSLLLFTKMLCLFSSMKNELY